MSIVSLATKCSTLQSPPPQYIGLLIHWTSSILDTIYWTAESSPQYIGLPPPLSKFPLLEKSHLRIIHSGSLHFTLMQILVVKLSIAV